MQFAVVLLVLTPFPGLQQVVADMVEGLVRVQNLSLRWIEQLPWASIDHVWVDMWDVVLFYFCLLLVCRVWARRTALNVYIALSGLLLGAAYHSYSSVADAPRRSIVFFIMSADVLPYIAWRIIPVHGWSAPTACPIRPICSVRFLPIGIACIWSAPAVIAGGLFGSDISVRNRIVFYAGKRICLLCDDRWRNKVSGATVTIDYLHVSQGYKGSIESLRLYLTWGTVVVDSSLSGYYRNRLIDDCISLGIPYLPLSEKGSVHILL